MPKQAKGEVRFSGGIWRARITLKGRDRLDLELPACTNQAEAAERALLLTEQAAHLRRAGKVETPGARGLLEELARASGEGITDAIYVIGEFCGAPTMPARLEGPTFSEVAKLWTSGDLARDWPDHVKVKDSAEDERKLKFLNEPSTRSAFSRVTRYPRGSCRSQAKSQVSRFSTRPRTRPCWPAKQCRSRNASFSASLPARE